MKHLKMHTVRTFFVRPAGQASRRRHPFLAVLALAFALWGAGGLQARAAAVNITIDLSAQRMYVSAGGRHYTWLTSTARRGYRTPIGTYRPIRLERTWYSRKYHMSPMPYSIFFRGGYAIHGTNEIRSLGRPASHGCVRLHPDNARILFDLVRAYGKRATRIVVRP